MQCEANLDVGVIYAHCTIGGLPCTASLATMELHVPVGHMAYTLNKLLPDQLQ